MNSKFERWAISGKDFTYITDTGERVTLSSDDLKRIRVFAYHPSRRTRDYLDWLKVELQDVK